jgi:hypothetical protein
MGSFMGFSGILPGLVVFLTLCKLEAMAAMAPRQSSMIYLKNGGFPARKLLVYQRGPVFFPGMIYEMGMTSLGYVS